MKEIGSFIELELLKGKEFYRGEKDVARLNTGRAAIYHALRLTGSKTIWIPFYQCESVREFLQKKQCELRYYHQDDEFNPIDLAPSDDDAVLLVNYFGIMSFGRMKELASGYNNVIIDNCQAFFCPPMPGAFTVYSARKFCGVADGAYVIGADAVRYVDEYSQCFSSDTAAFLLKRIEYGCEGEGYASRTINENRIDAEDIMKMSVLTRAMLDSVDYDYNQQRRKKNFRIAHELFGCINRLDPIRYLSDDSVPMVYPLVVEDDNILGALLAAKHFQGHWWKYITEELPEDTFEHWISKFVIPITIDQRYGEEDIRFISSVVFKAIQKG